ncbi:MAG: efflux RND transporter periplasmic adaptor subunit [Acidobacteria bacterium]|nr:MAG: efflux RND transporter periplasmic adaptor subunit [Acidobacteriota bacterium]
MPVGSGHDAPGARGGTRPHGGPAGSPRGGTRRARRRGGDRRADRRAARASIGKRGRTVRRLWPVLVAALLAAGCAAGGAEGPGGSEPEAAPASRGPSPVRVRVVRLEPGPFVEFLRLTGTTEPWTEVQVSSELGGTVREVGFDEGDEVRAGQVLARIGDDLAQARLDRARAELTDAESDYGKIVELVRRKAVPEQELTAATARRDRAAATVREAELLLERAVLRAPISGVAVERLVEPGEVVPPGAPITRILKIDPLKVELAVPDTELGWLRRGAPATVSVDAYPDREFPAKIHFIAPDADRDSRSFRVELELPNPNGRLKPGMTVRARLEKRRVEDAIVVPMDALLTRREGPVAYVVEECRAVRRKVRLEATEGGKALVGDGLVEGDLLVIEGQDELTPGRPVRTESCP